MWGEPREGTEAYAIKKEVERIQKAAQDKGLDQLFSKAFHDSIFAYASWIKDKRNKRYVHPDVISAKESTKKVDGNQIEVTEFDMGGKTYRIEESKRYGYINTDRYVDLTLFLNKKKVFAITETETSDEWATTYHPISVEAYKNDEWVDDFMSIVEHRKNVDKEVEIEFAEDPEKISKLKKDFNISKITKTNTQVDTQPYWKKTWFWFIVGLVVMWLISQ